MTNNDVLRSLRYALDLGNNALLACFAEVSVTLSPEQLAAMLKSEDEPGFSPLSDELLTAFLDGFVQKRRGKREQADSEAARRSHQQSDPALDPHRARAEGHGHPRDHGARRRGSLEG